VPEDVAKYFPADHVDPDGLYATSCGWIEAIGYNSIWSALRTRPRSYADLLDPKWQGQDRQGSPRL